MLAQLWRMYKIQLLISLTLTIVLSALSMVRNTQTYLFVFLAAFIGTFTLDLDYFIYAYFLEPTKSFSQTLRGYVMHRDFKNVLAHIEHNKEEVEDKTLHGSFFQILLAAVTIFAVSSTNNDFIKVFIISTFANSIYRLSDYYFDGRLKDWFWAMKKTPDKNAVMLYGTVLFFILIYSISVY